MDRHRVFKPGGKVGHVTHHVRQLFKVKRSKVKVTKSRDVWADIYELRFPLVTIENANAATAHAPNHVTREYGVKNNYIFGIPDPDLPIHYTTSLGLRRRLRVVYSRAVPCKPFSGHLAAILFYANYKVKTQNSAWEPGSSHSACLNYVKKSRIHFYPKMHLDDYWRPLFRNPSSLLGLQNGL